MEVRWTVHIPQAMQQHGGGPRSGREQTSVNAPALETKADDFSVPQSHTDKVK